MWMVTNSWSRSTYYFRYLGYLYLKHLPYNPHTPHNPEHTLRSVHEQ